MVFMADSDCVVHIFLILLLFIFFTIVSIIGGIVPLLDGFVQLIIAVIILVAFIVYFNKKYDKELEESQQAKEKIQIIENKSTTERERIPSGVRQNVWKRDGGKCVMCGSRERLEYDHIIPISKGGSNTERNIELLCEKCNRNKSDKIR